MSPGDPFYSLASLLMLLFIAVLGGVPVWLLLRRAAPSRSWLLALLWAALPLVAVLLGGSDPHDFIRYFVLPAFIAGAVVAALLCALANLRKRVRNP